MQKIISCWPIFYVHLPDALKRQRILASKGVPIKNVQAYLGHKDVQTTLNYYVHVLDADKIATATVMGNVFAGVVSPACSGSCSGTANEAADNVIPFASIVQEKLAEI
jgi:hypothetical protein